MRLREERQQNNQAGKKTSKKQITRTEKENAITPNPTT
jgi:hypothetical protein